MARLIYADDAYRAVIELSGQADTKSAYAAFWKAGKEIQKQPTVDAVEVVRCKDCKWWHKKYETKGICLNNRSEIVCFSNPDFFCAYGERRTDG